MYRCDFSDIIKFLQEIFYAAGRHLHIQIVI
jgi:hypothetical protein